MEGKACKDGACVASNQCIDECSPQYKTECSGTEGYKICSNYDEDPCLEWSAAVTCGADTTCKDRSCKCILGTKKCVTEGPAKGSSATCRPDGTWNIQECPKGCRDRVCISGVTSPVRCSNECSSSGRKVCVKTSGFKTCGNYCSDTCLEGSMPASCPLGKSCQNGECVKGKVYFSGGKIVRTAI